jgi:hypothetical protein
MLHPCYTLLFMYSQKFRSEAAASRGNCSYSVAANNRLTYLQTCEGFLANPDVYSQGLMQVGAGGVGGGGDGMGRHSPNNRARQPLCRGVAPGFTTRQCALKFCCPRGMRTEVLDG